MSASTTCVHCGAPLARAGAKFCTRCGKSQAVPAAPAAPPPTVIGMPAPAQAADGLRTPPPPSAAALVIQDEGATREAPLLPRPMTIGRAPDNDIVLTSRFVSARHARIEPEGDAHRIVDVGSTNGLLAGGRRLAANTPLALADGDVLRIGDPATGNFVTLTYRNARAARQPQAGAVARSFALDPGDVQITIGRVGCDITLDNPQVSRHHATIERAGAAHLLRDMGSTNGTFVNGRRITQHALAPGDVIQIGAFKLVYDGDSLDEYDQRGALRIDARNLWRMVARGGKNRMILKDVSLSIAPREFVALVGGSGTGKSTLLNALSGYAPASHGSVLVNGDDYYRNFDAYRTVLGYVPQEDILHRQLPVERALGYAAELRLPADTAPAEIARRITQVLDDVEMAPHRDKPVENLSGGQRKRVSIGAELLADPSLFFLDEPTSGLDPGLEKKMMYTLRRLADSGRTVVLVTHATANITQCDHVAFMSDGRMVFFGPPSEAPAFFGVASGDFADIYTKLEGLADPQDPERWAVVQRDLKAEYEAWQKHADRNTLNAEPRGTLQRSAFSVQPSLAELWEMKFRASPHYQRYVAGRLAQAPAGPVAGSADGAAKARTPRVSALRQFGILARRYLDLTVQDRRNLAILLLQAPIIGLLIMVVAKAGAIVGESAFANEAKKVLFMLATVAVWFGIINAAREITKEAPIFRRERLANLRIVPYVLSKVLVLSLLVAAQSAALLLLVGLKVQFPPQGVLLPIWLELFVTTVLTSLAGLAIGLAISAFAATPDRAISIVPLALIPQILFAGVIFSLGDGVTVQRALSWLTVSRWAMDAYGTSVNLNDLPLQPGMLRLPNPPAEYTYTAEHLLSRWVILAGYAVACLIVTGWLLKRQD
ncbi:MAG TPA: FHA domain-containing protein [Roseiflexaceae bacterium]|nr:FHA domain-containing protein [Roseiflexaceae bacterium]